MALEGIEAWQSGLTANFEAVRADFQAGVYRIAEEAAKAGAVAMHTVIATVPSSLSPGKVGRIYTGLMDESVTSNVLTDGTVHQISFGWLNELEDYFMVQEHGGSLNGITITPMDALVAGFTVMDEYITASMTALTALGK